MQDQKCMMPVFTTTSSSSRILDHVQIPFFSIHWPFHHFFRGQSWFQNICGSSLYYFENSSCWRVVCILWNGRLFKSLLWMVDSDTFTHALYHLRIFGVIITMFPSLISVVFLGWSVHGLVANTPAFFMSNACALVLPLNFPSFSVLKWLSSSYKQLFCFHTGLSFHTLHRHTKGSKLEQTFWYITCKPGRQKTPVTYPERFAHLKNG